MKCAMSTSRSSEQYKYIVKLYSSSHGSDWTCFTLCKGRGLSGAIAMFCGVTSCWRVQGSLTRAQVGVRRGTEATLLQVRNLSCRQNKGILICIDTSCSEALFSWTNSASEQYWMRCINHNTLLSKAAVYRQPFNNTVLSQCSMRHNSKKVGLRLKSKIGINFVNPDYFLLTDLILINDKD